MRKLNREDFLFSLIAAQPVTGERAACRYGFAGESRRTKGHCAAGDEEQLRRENRIRSRRRFPARRARQDGWSSN